MADTNQLLRYVHLEDNEADVVLIRRALREGGFDPQVRRVETADGFAAAIQEQGLDLILADWVLPQFSAPAALAQLNGFGLDLPVIIVTGAVGEETAVEALKSGAHNYVMKDRLIRLVPAVQQALRETNERRARKQAEARLRLSEEEHRALFEYSPLMCFLLDSEGIVLKVNRLGAELLGYEVHELVGRSVFSVFPEEYRDEAAGYTAACFAGPGSQLASWELQKQRKDGSRIWVKEFARTLTDGQGRRTLLISCEDMTERRRTEAALYASQEQIRQMQKMDALGQLAGGVAHDFNNLLTAILGNAEMAVERLDVGHPSRVNLSRIIGAGNRASQLVQQILTFTRQQEVSRSAQSLAPIVTEALGLLRATLPAGVTLTSTFEPATPPVSIDAAQFHQVLMNLYTNAWHALQDQPGTIEVNLAPVTLTQPLDSFQTTLRPGSYARLSISDTGCGMDSGTLGR
ncbi:MAG: PAS domain S-box protein, partial [Nitrospira sp.]|nr:PAS domain S-box protein [Nitrospira sp.]